MNGVPGPKSLSNLSPKPLRQTSRREASDLAQLHPLGADLGFGLSVIGLGLSAHTLVPKPYL